MSSLYTVWYSTVHSITLIIVPIVEILVQGYNASSDSYCRNSGKNKKKRTVRVQVTLVVVPVQFIVYYRQIISVAILRCSAIDVAFLSYRNSRHIASPRQLRGYSRLIFVQSFSRNISVVLVWSYREIIIRKTVSCRFLRNLQDFC